MVQLMLIQKTIYTHDCNAILLLLETFESIPLEFLLELGWDEARTES